MKFIKWLLAIVVVAILSVVVYITVIFDPNDFKPEIVDAVKKQTGRDLAIKDDLSWTFFPSLGISLGNINLSNPDGFTPAQMVFVNQAVAEVALMPLLKKEIEIDKLSLDGLTVNLVTRKNGASSLDGLTGEGDKTAVDKSDASADKGPGVSLASLHIGGVEVTNTQINMLDEASGSEQSFNLESFNLGEFRLGEVASFSYRFTAQLPDLVAKSQGEGKLIVSKEMNAVTISDFVINNHVKGAAIPNGELESDLTTQIAMALDAKTLVIDIQKLSADTISGKGKIDINYAAKVPKIKASLEVGDIDLNRFIPADTAKADDKTVNTPDNANATEPDLTGLKGLDLTLALKAKSIKVAKMSTENWALNLSLKNGVLDLSSLTADLYQGKLQVKAQLDARQKVASYQFDKRVSGVQIRPLLIDAADVDILSGTANFNVVGKGSSLIPDNVKQNLNANGKFEVADGSLYGVNIPQMIRSAQAKLKGDLAAKDTEERKTDFSSLAGSFTVDKGVVTNPDLAMASPLIRLKGAGTANIVSQALDYKLTTTVVGSLKGQEAGSDPLAGVDIPLMITGTMQKPEYALDTAALFDAKLKQETDKAKDKLKDSLLKKLGGF